MSSTRPRRRRLRSLVVVLVILVGLGYLGDRVAERLAEDQLATVAADEAARYDVRAASTAAEVDGPAFLPQLARGEFSRITLTMDRPTILSVPASDLTATLNGIHVPRDVLTRTAGATVTVDTADLGLRLSPESLTRLVARTTEQNGLTLRIVEGELRARVAIRGFEADASVRPQAENGRIRLTVDDLPAEVPSVVREAVESLLAKGIALPELPFEASLQRIAVDGQSVVLTATAADVVLATG